MNNSDSVDNRFRTTSWTQVIASRGSSLESQQALRDLSVVYYPPVECFIRRYRNSDDASDLTQAFFAKLLEGKSLQRVEKSKGRFRSYLLGAVKHFLADHDDRQRATKRGGDKEAQSISPSSTSDDASEGTDIIDPRGFPPDAYFDRQWAVTLVEHSIETLRQQATTLGDCSRFDALKPWIVTAATPDEAEQAASSLGMTVGAYNVAVHRLPNDFAKSLNPISRKLFPAQPKYRRN